MKDKENTRERKSKKSFKFPALNLKVETKKEVLAVILFALALVSLLSYLNFAGIFGNYFLQAGESLFGRGYFLIPLSLILGGVSIIKSLHEDIYASTFVGMGLFVLSFLGLFNVLMIDSEVSQAGGYLGKIIGSPLIKLFDFWASLIILLVLILISVLITFNFSIKNLVALYKEAKDNKPSVVSGNESVVIHNASGEIDNKKNAPKPSFRMKNIADEIGVNDDGKNNMDNENTISTLPLASSRKSSFQLPPLDILESDKGEPSSGDIQANATIIKRTLANFSIEVEMAEVNVGPTVTQYTLRPAQGIKLTKITGLANDLALSLAAHPIRIEAPIPGRSLVGIEIPNKTATKVRMRNLLASPLLQEKNSNLCLALGRDVAGIPIFPDLAKMPHLLIAGATGTGKTICLNALITSLLYQNTPENLRFILIDPKRVEFTPYMGIPHLLTPVILNPEKAVNALRWAVGEMERRFDVLSGLGARDITSYNNKLKAKSDEDLMPFIVIVIDELADLMSTFGREMEAAIVRIAQMARAVGIHLVLATQRPSVEVITGLIKANITTRIAFQVASQIDSRTILDSAGAEKLLGNGDLLLLSAESSKPRRVQGVFISEKEVKSTTDYLKDAGEVSYQEEIIQPKQSQTDSEIAGENSGDDELYGEARRTVIEAGKASASLLQRRLRVGYARAARLLDILESNGIIGPSDGAKPRDILIATPNEDSDIYSQEN